MFRHLLAGALLVMAGAGLAGAEQLQLPEGNPVRGRKVFIENYCSMCHHVAGHETPKPMKTPWTDIRIGGPGPAPSSTRLVNDIVNPQHRIDPEKWPDPKGTRISPMIDFTVNLTVRDLIDLVQFLKMGWGMQAKR